MNLLSFYASTEHDNDPTHNWWYGTAGRKSVSGVTITEDSALNYSAAWAATRVLCAAGSSLPLNIYRKLGARKKEIASDHAAHRLMHFQPNPEMGAMMFRATLLNHQINWGGGFAEIVRKFGKTGPPTELWPIHPSRIQPTRFDGDVLGYRVRNKDGSHDDFQSNEIFHVPSIISTNGIVGKGVIENARESLGFGIAVERQGAAYFANSARPSVVITGGKFKGKEERDEYRRQWLEIHGGVEKNAMPAVLPEGGDVKFLSFNQEDSQFLQTREHNISEMSRWYGVPAHMIGDLRRATFSNIESQGIDFVVYSEIPWLTIWEQEIFRKLLSEDEQKDHYAKHVVNGLMRGDSAARAAFYKSLFEIGVFSINDIRELEDMDEIGPDGDKHFVPLNFTTAEKAGTESAPQPKLLATEKQQATAVIDEPQMLTDETTGQPSALETRCREVLGETVGRLLNKECRACEAAAKNNHDPKQFFAWLDEYYDRYEATFSDAITPHIEILSLATDDSREVVAIVTSATVAHITASKEDVLRATEVAASEWASVPERIAACGERWKTERTNLLGV